MKDGVVTDENKPTQTTPSQTNTNNQSDTNQTSNSSSSDDYLQEQIERARKILGDDAGLHQGDMSIDGGAVRWE